VVSCSLQIQRGCHLLKPAHKSGTVLKVVEILSHKIPFNLLRRAR
jgi:hypothetical protein